MKRYRAFVLHCWTSQCANNQPTTGRVTRYSCYWGHLESVVSMGVRRGGKNGHLPPLEIGTKKEKFLENMKSAV